MILICHFIHPEQKERGREAERETHNCPGQDKLKKLGIQGLRMRETFSIQISGT